MLREFTPRTGMGCKGVSSNYKAAAMKPNRAGRTKRCARKWAADVRFTVKPA